MQGVVVGVFFGLGAIGVWSSFWETLPSLGPSRRVEKLSGAQLPAALEWWQLGAGGAVMVVVSVVTGVAPLGVALGMAVLVAPALGRGGSAEADFASKTDAVAAWVESLRDLMRGTHGIEGALRASAENAPPALKHDLLTMNRRVDTGQPLRLALVKLAEDVNNPICDLVVALLVNTLSSSAMQVPTLLGEISDHARDRAHQHLQVHTSRQKQRTQLRLVGMIVFASSALFIVLFRGYLAPLGSGVGQVLLIGAAVVTGLLLLWIANLSTLAPIPRVLDPAKFLETHA